MKTRKLANRLALCVLAFPAAVFAQNDAAEDETVEEIIVTGSFIKRDKFDLASPVETISAEAIQTSGYTNVGSFVRDLTYTSNVDTVANVLAVADGQQDSNSARFNLRGLGTSSTLTLFDGRRVLNSGAIAGIVPDIATERVDVILDGGAATYGTDAVAGVVNIVPVTRYDGFKIRGFYSRDGEGDFYEPKLSMLFGKTFNDKLDVVTALEYSEREDVLYRSDRPEYLRADNDSSLSGGNPGSFTVPLAVFALDPECGTGNEGNTDHGADGAYPGGIPALPIAGRNALCLFEYGQFQDYKRPYEDLVGYVSTTYAVNDKLSLEMLLNLNDRTSVLHASPSTAERGSNDLLTIPADHPANRITIGGIPRASSPRSWRPFTDNGATQPSHLNSAGADDTEYNYKTYSLALGASFDIGDTSWSGETFVTSAQSTTEIKGDALNLDRLTLALLGQGGPNGDQWFNPFFSASTFSPTYNGCEVGTAAGCTANDQGLVDWLYQSYDYESLDTDYFSVEGFVTGDLFELPAGTMQLAVGAQYRVTEFSTDNSPLGKTPSTIHTSAAEDGGPASQDYNQAVVNGVTFGTSGESAVRSVFAELSVPILESLEMTLAARYEDFTDLNVSAAVPKVSFRWQPLESLAVRTSYGEGFLAPTVTEITANPSASCGELFSGNDPVLGGSLGGRLACVNGNPDLDPEESTIFNVGATWQATDDFELSLDYQQIDYVDRIIRLSSTDTLNVDFANFLDSQGLSEDQFDGLSAAQQLAAFLPWANGSQSDPGILRDPITGGVLRVTSVPNNIAEVEVDVIDFRMRYGMDFGNYGYASANWSTTWYTRYEYVDAFGDTADAAGKRNADTDIAPPLPEMKHQLRLSWLLDSHAVGVTFNYQDEVEFDGTDIVPSTVIDTGEWPIVEVPETIDAQTIIDLRYSYTFEEMWGGRFDLALGSNNVTDKRPQVLPVLAGLETRLQDPSGRSFYIEGTYSFD